MISPSPHRQKIHLGPGSVFTGTRAYACDGLLLEAKVEGSAAAPTLSDVRILEVHDVNVGHRRTQYDVGAFLRRCLRRIRDEGLILIQDDQIIPVDADEIAADSPDYKQFCSRLAQSGPFA